MPSDSQSPAPDRLFLPAAERAAVLAHVTQLIEAYVTELPGRRVAAALDPTALRAALAGCDFATPRAPGDALDFAACLMLDHQTHTAHPRCFGLFVPAPTTMGIAAEALVAAFNPQIANWAHSPAGVEIERHLLQAIAARTGFAGGDGDARIDGTFTSGGAEANHSALVTALIAQAPEVVRDGVAALSARPALYVSSEAHHSIAKAARLSGLGDAAVRVVPCDDQLRMDVARLSAQIAQDRRAGWRPFLVVATAGSTNAGAIDPIDAIADVAAREELWLHVDGAWGAAAAIVPELRGWFAGLSRADSLTIDAHKWLSVPMGAGMHLTRHPAMLERTFRVATAYMPAEARALAVDDPYARSMQWSRRFSGLKLLLTLMVAGWDGMTDAIRRSVALGGVLRGALTDAGWQLAHTTPLPVACFRDGAPRDVHAIAEHVRASGRAWLSTTTLSGAPVLRACISNLRTTADDVAALIAALDDARRSGGFTR